MGPPREIEASLNKLALDAPVPLAAVACEGKAFFLGSPAEFTPYPDCALTMAADQVQAFAGVPVWANGELRGVLGLTWINTRRFDSGRRTSTQLCLPRNWSRAACRKTAGAAAWRRCVHRAQ